MRKFLFFLLIIFSFLGCKTKPSGVDIMEPDFQILSIAIVQADLVNTMFEAVIKIDNPNNFAIDLSSLTYELYGNGRFWASGTGIDLLHIPALYSSEAEFQFSMNFINMNRSLLDDVIAMRKVNYRFAGAVEVAPDIPRVSAFNMSFERSGLSDVKEKAERKVQTNGAVSYPTQSTPYVPSEAGGNGNSAQNGNGNTNGNSSQNNNQNTNNNGNTNRSYTNSMDNW